jgi:hypothetical protein
MKKLFFLTAIGFLACASIARAQEAEQSAAMEEGGFRPHHRITLMMANVHIPDIVAHEGGSKQFLLPAWGLDYDYWFAEKWAVGLHNNMILQEFKVEEGESGEEVDVSYPLSVSLTGLFMPVRHLTLIAGVGREFEKTENLSLIEFGLEYGFELPDEWELSLNLKYEDKFDAYDSWLFGFGISKIFGRE